MKTGLSIILAIVLLLPIGLKIVVFLDYLVRQNYYAQTLCVNKPKGDLKCKGKCALMQNLQETETEESKIPSRILFKILSFEYTCTTHGMNTILTTLSSTKVIATFALKHSFYSFNGIVDIFHPPR